MAYIILDRDGVINFDSEEYIKTPEEWQPIPGSLEAIAKLNQYGYKVLIATNQSGISRGFYDISTLEDIHAKMHAALAEVGGKIHDIFYCPHHPLDNCFCRKPKPGLLYQIRDKYNINLKKTFFVGDSAKDIEAAIASGCLPLLVLTGNGKLAMEQKPSLKQIIHFKDLAEAVNYVISCKGK